MKEQVDRDVAYTLPDVGTRWRRQLSRPGTKLAWPQKFFTHTLTSVSVVTFPLQKLHRTTIFRHSTCYRSKPALPARSPRKLLRRDGRFWLNREVIIKKYSIKSILIQTGKHGLV